MTPEAKHPQGEQIANLFLRVSDFSVIRSILKSAVIWDTTKSVRTGMLTARKRDS